MSSAFPICTPYNIFAWLFLPEGYPDSVVSEYFEYQLWDTIQQVLGFVNGILGNQAMYAFFGVGNSHAAMAWAIFLQFSRDLMHHYFSLGVSFPAAVALYQSRPGLFRMIGEVLNVAGIISEILACRYRSMLLMWMGPVFWCIYASIDQVVRSCILQHFAKNENTSEVVLKETNQDKGGKFAGLIGGVIMLQFLGMHDGILADEDAQTWPSLISAACISLVHLYSNYRAVRALQCPPSHFSLRNSTSQQFAVVRNGRLVEETSDQNAEVFKCGTVLGVGKILMTSQCQYVDEDGHLEVKPVKPELDFTGGGRLMVANWGSKLQSAESNTKSFWQVIPKTALQKEKASSCGIRSSFFPPGFPRTTPAMYEEHCAYSILQVSASMPINFVSMWLTWKFVYGVGDASKSPEYAVLITCYVSGISVIFGLIAGFPTFAQYYNAHSYWIVKLCSFFAGFLGIVAALSPLPVFLGLTAIQRSIHAWENVVVSVINAKANTVWSRHPEIDLAHISSSQGNRKSALSGLTGALCVWFAHHLSHAGSDAEPPLTTMVVWYAFMQVAELYFCYKIYSIYDAILITDVKDDYARVVEGAATELQAVAVIDNSREVTILPSARSATRGQESCPGAILKVLPGILVEVFVYGALVSTLSDVRTKLQPCSETCMQFKFMSDEAFIPNTGIWPFGIRNGQSQHEIEDTCVNFGGNFCDALPGAHCEAVEENTCRSDLMLNNVVNPLKHTKSKYFFLVFLAVYSSLTLVHDSGLQMKCLDSANAIIIRVASTYALAMMTGAALVWSSGAMELFFSNVAGESCVGQTKCNTDSCGCYYKMADIPSMLALAVPASLTLTLRTQTICTMRSAIVGSSFLSTMKYHIPHNFWSSDSDNVWSALGPRGFGHPQVSEASLVIQKSPRMKLAKSMARWISVFCPLIILPPLLFASCSLIYRGIALCLQLAKDLLSIDATGDVASSLAMCGFYGMIFLQFIALYLFIPETWRLFYILSIQVRECDGDLSQVVAQIKTAHPELAWSLENIED